MAKTRLNLQAYQQDILARLKHSSEHAGSAAASRLGVMVNGMPWLVSLDDVSEVIALPEITRVPLTQAWFMGIANIRGNLYALTDLADFFGHAPTNITIDSRILLVNQKFGFNAGLLVERLIGLRSLDEMTLQSDAGQLPAWCVNQYKDKNNEIWHEIDIGSLLNQNQFIQIAA
jgi:twitching motility protein PilI